MLLVVTLGLVSCGDGGVKYNVSFIVDGEVYATVEADLAESISMPENPAKDGYTFDGWYWDKDVWASPLTANSLMDSPLSSNMSVYAKESTCQCGDTGSIPYLGRSDMPWSN